MTRRARVAVLVLALAGGAHLARSQEPDALDDELGALQRAIEARRTRLAAYETRERGLLDLLEEIDRASADLAKEVSRAERAVQEAEAAAARAEAGAQDALARQEATRRAMSQRAVALYKMGDVGPARLLFSVGDLRELVARVQRLRALLARDAELLARYQADTAAVVAARASVETAVARRARSKARLAGGTRALAEERESRRELLGQLRADRARERAGLEELEAAARALESKLEDLGRAPGTAPSRPRTVPFASLRGRLAPPVAGAVSRPFGRVVDAEFRTETFRKGVDFEVRLGQPVHAVADGEVRYAGWFRGYGKLVILDHGEQWFTVAGHLAELGVEVGNSVRAGDDIGSAGDTGSLRGAILYFEIRHGSEAVDPSEWLERSPRLE